MKYQFTTDVPGYRKGDIANFDPNGSQVQERLQRGIIKPYEEAKPFDPVEETKPAKPVKEVKRKRSKKADD